MSDREIPPASMLEKEGNVPGEDTRKGSSTEAFRRHVHRDKEGDDDEGHLCIKCFTRRP